MDDVPISRRKVVGVGIAAGLALATGSTNSVTAKAPWSHESPEFEAAYMFAIPRDCEHLPDVYRHCELIETVPSAEIGCSRPTQPPPGASLIVSLSLDEIGCVWKLKSCPLRSAFTPSLHDSSL
jgi:hypothetical protein